MKIEVRHLSRIEGHAHLVIDAAEGVLRECRLEVVESPRFFEAILKGCHYRDVASLIARICGVCSNSHTLASLAATEAALGVQVSDQTVALRRLLAHGEILQSHLLHLYFMAVPDYLGVASLFPLARSQRELVARALRLKKVANDLCQTIGGRSVHPVTPCVGGFAALPEVAALQSMRRLLVQTLPDLEETVELFASLPLPDFSRPNEGLSLADDAGYPLFGDRLTSTAGRKMAVADCGAAIGEFLPSHSTAKFARLDGGSYSVGPLARFRNAAGTVSPMARQVAAVLGLAPTTANPYHSLWARLVEVVHGVEESIRLIDTLLLDGLKAETPSRPTRGGGYGKAAVEAPRGTLFHAYGYDDEGRLEAIDCVIPTAQNLASIEADLTALVPSLLDLPREELTRKLEMLVRAYDPCISCSTHLLKVEFV